MRPRSGRWAGRVDTPMRRPCLEAVLRWRAVATALV